MDDNKRKLYDALSQDYDMGSYEQFSNDVKDEGKRRKLYDAIKEEYDLPDFDGFSSQLLGGGADNVRQTSQQRVKPQPKPQAKKPAQPHYDTNVPNLYQMLDEQKEKDQHMNPQFQSKVIQDWNGNRVRVPKVEQRPIYNGSPQVSPVIKDSFGNEYDATDPETLQQAKKQIKQLPKTEEEERAKWQRDKDMQNDPSLTETIGKSVAAGFTRVGAGLVDALNWMMSGSYAYKVDPKTGQMVVTTPSYTERAQDKDLTLTKASNYLNEKADKMSKESQPYGGQKGFVDLLWNEKKFGAALQKGVSVAGESLPMTLSWANPYTATLNAVSMAGTNMRNETLENPDAPEWKRGAYAIGQAAIEQAVEKWSDPFFKYVGGAGTRILKGAGKEASKEIVQKTTKEAVDNIAKRIYHRLGDVAKDAAGEGAEEIVGNFGNDLLGEALDRMNGVADYGIEAQWKEIKEKNPDANLMDFAEAKAKEYTDAFLGGAMAGAYTAGSTMTSIKALEYASKMPTKKGDKIDPITLDVAQSFDEGYAEDDSQAMNDAKNRYDLQRQRMTEVMGEDGIATFDENPVQALASASQNDLFTDEQKQIMIDYVNSKAAYDGMTQRVRDDIDSRIAESDAMVSDRVHEDGMIHPATMKVDNRQVYIVGGNVVMNEDGTMVDREKSDESVIIRDAETGDIEFADPRDIFSIGDTIDAEEEATTAREAIRQQFAQEAASKIEGTLPFNDGDTYDVVDDEGQPHSVSILPLPEGAAYVQGTVFASIDGQEPSFIESDKVQQMADNANLARLQQEEEQRAAAFAERQADFTETPENYAQNQQEIIPETAEQQPEVSDAMPMIGEGEDAEPDFTSVTPERGHKYLYNEAELTRDEANQFVAANKKAAEDALKKITDKKPKMGTSLAKYRKEITAWEGEAQKAQTSVDYWNAIAEKQSQIEKAEDEAWFKQSTEDAAGRAAVIDEQKNQKQQIEAAKKMYGSYFDDDMEVPQDINELIAMNLPKGISWEGHDDVKGIMQEAGFKKRGTNGSSDTKPFNSYLAKKGEGIGFNDAVHSVYESPQNQLEDGEHRFDSDEIRNALIDMFASANGTGYFENYVLNNRIAQAEKNRQAEDDYKASLEAADNAIIQATGMTDSDYNDWIESLESMVAEQNGQNKDEYFNNNNNEGRTEINASGSTAEGASAVQGQESVETPAQANGSAGTATDADRERISLFFDEVGVNGSLAYKMTDDEIIETERLIDAWEVVNDEYGQVQEQMKSALKSKNKEDKANAEKLVKEAQERSIEASKPAEEYIRKVAAKYGFAIDDDTEPTTEQPTQNNKKQAIAEAEAEVNTEPTDAQKEAGNYKKGHVTIDGLDITIENPKGSTRSGKDASGKEWSQVMHNTYGYIRGTEGVDGDHIDVFLNDEPEFGNVYVVDQVNKDGSFDEHKVMYGFRDMEIARKAYLSNYEEGWTGLGAITQVTKDEFKKWIESSHRKTKPFSEYKSVKTEGDVQTKGYEISEFTKGKAVQGLMNVEEASVSVNGEKVGRVFKTDSGFYAETNLMDWATDTYQTADEAVKALLSHNDSEGAPVQDAAYTIEPTTYTNKKGKETPMHLVKFNNELTKEQIAAGKVIAKESKGWWDREQQGFMMRSEESAKALADKLSDNEEVADAQPLSAQDMADVTDIATEHEEIQESLPEQSQSESVKPHYSERIEDDYRERYRESLNKGIEDGSLTVEKLIGKIKTINKEIEISKTSLEQDSKLGEEISMSMDYSHIAAATGKLKACNDIMPKLKEKIRTEERENALAAHGVKIGDKITYKGEEATIFDADANHVVLDTGMAPVIYEQVEWADVETGKQASETKPSEPKRLVSDSRMEELKERMRKKLGGQMNMGVDPEILAIGAELAVGYIERGATKFADYAKQMVGDLGDTIRPYLKSFYNAVRDMPEAESYVEQMDSYDDVRLFDVANFDKANTDAMAAAAEVVAEQEAEKQAEEGKAKLTEQRNIQRKEQEKRDSVAEDGTPLRKATTEDFDTTNRVYRHGKPYGIILITRKGEQVDALHFSKPEVTSVMLHDGSYADISELWVPDVKPALQNTSEPQKTEKKPKKSSKKSVNSQQMPDLFGDLFNNETENNEQLQTTNGVQPEGNAAESDQPKQGGEREQASTSEGVGQESARPNTIRGGRSTEQNRSVQPRLQRLEESQRKNVNNNHAERGKDYAPNSVDARINANIKAIELMKQLIENDEKATPEQMAVLRQYSGWGGLGKAFENEYASYNGKNLIKYLRELLGDEAYEQANMSRNSAYYTPANVIDTLWDIARAMGFQGGNTLEGSAGIGNIIGLMPEDMSERSNIRAVEIDQTTGNILQLLYPDAKVDIQGFEATDVENGSVDLAITNVPFVTGLRVNDTTGDKDLSSKFHDIHDFCIAKNIRKLREGGIGIFITSSGTLDNSTKLREWIVNDGNTDVVGAFRLNNETFGGTGATSDIILVRKRVNGKKSANAIDVLDTSVLRTAEYDTGETKRKNGFDVPVIKNVAMVLNKYFAEHPEMMAGEMHFGFEMGDNYRATSRALYPVQSKNQSEMLKEWASSFSEKDWEQAAPSKKEQAVTYDELGEGVKEGSVILDKSGNICMAQRGKAVPMDINANKVKGHTKAECLKAYNGIKDSLSALMDYQTKNEGDEGLQPLINALNKAYDDFVKTYGYLHKNTSISFLKNDVDFANIIALEKFSETGDPKTGKRIQHYGKTDVFSKRVIEKEKEPQPTNVKDAIISSLYVHGRIDLPWMVEQLNKNEGAAYTEDSIKDEIVSSGMGFENPVSRQMDVVYEYLSGNVREKLRQARENNANGKYDKNIAALENVIPMNIPAHLIDFSLGSSWVKPSLYEEYVKEKTNVSVKLTSAGGSWDMETPYYVNEEMNRAMGVVSKILHKTIMGTDLIAAAINNKTIEVKSVSKVGGETVTTVDKEATQACAVRVDEIRQDFKDWARNKMQNDSELSSEIENSYNERFNNFVPKSIPDDFVPEYFGGASHNIKLRPHQAKAVIRGTTQPLLLAHEVGSGKTFTLISTAMEMRRLGTARKPMIVVQNATVGQFVESAKTLYPNAKILTIEDKDKNAEGRKNFYAKIKYNDWDMIVVPQSVFEFIPDSRERQIKYIQEKIDEKMQVLEDMKETDNNSMIVRNAEKEIEKLEEELSAVANGGSTSKSNSKADKKKALSRQNAQVRAEEMLDRKTDDVENFDDMEIDAILVDEAHEYKHLGFATAMQRGVKGIDPSYSKKAQGVFLKAQAVLEKNNGKNVVFATGTPISNTAAEIWTFMRYLMPSDTMKEYGIYYFDDFVRNFGNLTQMLEFTTSGKFKEVNRFAGYFNLPELVRIWSSISDTVLNKEIEAQRVAEGGESKIPEMEGGKAQDLYLPQTRALRSVMKYVRKQLDKFEKMSGKEKKENKHIPLKMYQIAKAAAVDARLVTSNAEDDKNSKNNEAVRQTMRALKETESYKGTVSIFADNYQNKRSGFNLYEDIRQKLIDAGVPEEQIVVMKSGMSVKKKLEIFDAVNRGDIRVILGSTFTLGTGVNIQERLHTLIHLDAPDRPMDYTQRNGRILRQGNLHKQMDKPVRVLRFGVEDSLDVTAYQRLKTKGAIADSIMNGKSLMTNSMENRSLEEEEDVFGDTVAQLSGSEYAMLKNQAEKNVRKYEAKLKQYEADQTYCHNAIPKLTSYINDAKRQLEEYKDALNKVSEARKDKPEIVVDGKTFNSVEGMAEYIKEYNKKIRAIEDDLRDNPSIEEKKNNLIVKVNGIEFAFTASISIETISEQGTLFTSVHRSLKYSCPELHLKDEPARQSLLREGMNFIVDYVMTGKYFEDLISYRENYINREEENLSQIKERYGKPFEFTQELEEAQEHLEEYSELMKKEMEEKEKKYAEMDADVEEASDIAEASEDEEDEDEDLQFRDDDDDTTNDVLPFSKIRDKEGKLVLLYHGGDSSIDNASSNSMYGKAYYATPSKGEADYYTKERGGNTHEVYLDVRNPFIEAEVEELGYPATATDEEVKELIDALAEKGLKEPYRIYRDYVNGKINGSLLGYLSSSEYEGVERPTGTMWHAADIVNETLKELGYDGVVGKYMGENFYTTQVAAFSPEQVINKDDIDVQYRDNNSDADFADAVERGDKDAIKKAIIDAAEKAMPFSKVRDKRGNLRVMYHGTTSKEGFNEFDSDAIYMTSKPSLADQYTHKRRALSVDPKQSGRVMPVFVNIERPYVVEANRRLWDNINVSWSKNPVSTDDIVKYAKKHGYDGVIIKNVRDNMFNNDKAYGDDVIAFSSSQVKATGASYEQTKRWHFPWDEYDRLQDVFGATYDEEGNLIPLSERFNTSDSDIRYRTSEELNNEYGSRWLDEQTNEDGRHTTQVKNTINSYRKFGEFVKRDSNGRDVSVLDASSGLGLGTEWMRENGINVDDVEPFPSENRAEPTYKSYDDIDKKYDYIISNAVLNVIPDDWRANVLHDMADKLKQGGKLVINVRGAESIKNQGVEGKTRTTLDDKSEILVHRPDGSIKAYQKGFTKAELKEWCQNELGEGYSVENATNANAGGTYDTAVVVTKLGNEYRDGEGDVLNTEESLASSLRAGYTERQYKAFMKRQKERMRDAAMNLAEKMNIADNVEIIEDATGLEGRKANAKGWHDAKTGKIVIILSNNGSISDIMQTVLHEGVAHYGLRKLFGENFDTFLYNVFSNADTETRSKIVDLSKKRNWNVYTATEEYLARLAENTDFERAMKQGWWSKIKSAFLDMLSKLGIKDGFASFVSDNELRYILWRSYKNLTEPDNYRNVFALAEDISKQHELKVGEYKTPTPSYAKVAEPEKSPIAEYIDNIPVKHNLKGAAIHQVVNGRSDIEQMRGVVSDEAFASIVRKYNKKGCTGIYLPANNLVIIFGDKVSSKESGEYTYWHEQTHGFWSTLPDDVAKKYGRACMEKLEKEYYDIYRHISDNYDKEDLENEACAYFVESIIKKFGADKFLSAKFNGNNEDLLNFATELRNYLQNGKNDGDRSRQLGRVRNSSTHGRSDLPRRTDERQGRVYDRITERDRAIARDAYERMMRSGLNQFIEATQDSMLGLKKLYEAIIGKGKRIEDVAGFENAYLAENRMSSQNLAEQHEYYVNFMLPLIEEIGKIAGSSKAARQELVDYMMAKHGLERNDKFAERDAKEAALNEMPEYPKVAQFAEDATDAEGMDAYKQACENWNETLERKTEFYYDKFKQRDYAGLTALTGKEDVADAEFDARLMVSDYEKEHDTTDLWDRVREATQATLERVYKSGNLSKDSYERIRDMFQNYIPLQGWSETTSDEVYGYLTAKDGLYGSPIKHARGRNSKADDPIATIAMSAEHAINQANRNLMKQRFLTFVENHPSDLVSVNELWLHYNDAEEQWKPVFPDLNENDTPEEVERKVKAFEAHMNALSTEFPDEYKRGKDTINVPFKVVKGNLKEHQVLVKRKGRTYVLTINGNPRAAQALNGLTNPDVETKGALGNILRKWEVFNRKLSSFYTTRNPGFVASNLFRDMLYSNCMTWVKESPLYALRFQKNFARYNHAVIYRLLKKWEKGTLDRNNRSERLFYEFMSNGGETGYTSYRDIEEHKKAITAELKKQGSLVRKAFGILGMQFDLLNRSVENCARFAAFVTSIESGRTIDRSIYDAKEVSVNFNKKGSGGKMVDAVGQTKFGKFGGYLGGLGRLLYVFWSAGVQGMTNFGRSAKRHPAKFITMAAAVFTLGYLQRILAEMMGGGDGDDDDKDAYYNLPEYVRRSNICIRAGENWITIPLPIELRSLFGLGELASGVLSGNEYYDDNELAYQISSQVSQVLPVDMLEGGGGFHALIPSNIKPLAEAYLNKSWSGIPIYRENEWEKDNPEWTKAFSSTDQTMVDAARVINEKTGGSRFESGSVDINPARVEYMLNGYFGGYSDTASKLKKMAETAFGDREFEWRNMLVANRLIKTGDERTERRRLKNEYYKYLEEYRKTKSLHSKYKNAADDGEEGMQEHLDKLENEPRYLRVELIDDYRFDREVKALNNDLEKETDPDMQKQIEDEMYSVMREMVDVIHELDKAGNNKKD